MTEIVALQTHRAPERGRFKKTAKQKILFTELAQLLHCFSQNTKHVVNDGRRSHSSWVLAQTPRVDSDSQVHDLIQSDSQANNLIISDSTVFQKLTI